MINRRMRNADGLTQKEWLFAEEYLKDGNMERAYRVAFPNDKGRNGWRTAKRKEVICYISKRLHEKQATLIRLREKSHQSLLEKLGSTNSEISLEASKIVARLEELELKYKEIEAMQQQTNKEVTSGSIVINFTDASKKD